MNDTNLVEDIIKELNEIPNALGVGRGNRVWTAEIKHRLRTLGKKNDYSVCPNDDEGQWLFDLVWFRNTDGPKHLRNVKLVVESEWSRWPDDIQYDFEKLLVARSPLKLMVFQDEGDNLPQLWSLLKTGIDSFESERANEKYVLAAFREDEFAFTTKIITT